MVLNTLTEETKKLVEVTMNDYYQLFPKDPHPFLSKGFIELNQAKVSQLVFLVDKMPKPSIGLVAGITQGVLSSPFSAPFGGFHYHHEAIYISTIETFIDQLIEYAIEKNIQSMHFTFSPAIYQFSFNAKLVNVLYRKSFQPMLPDLTHWIKLGLFTGTFVHKRSDQNIKKAIKEGLTFEKLETLKSKKIAFQIIVNNRVRLHRPIYMNFEALLLVEKLWPVDYFGVFSNNKKMIASAILYEFPSNIACAIFWGDEEEGRGVRSMDFLVYQLIIHYKKNGFEYIDLGISTETGIPNEGLLRFKETHEAFTSLRHKFIWENKQYNKENYIENKLTQEQHETKRLKTSKGI